MRLLTHAFDSPSYKQAALAYARATMRDKAPGSHSAMNDEPPPVPPLLRMQGQELPLEQHATRQAATICETRLARHQPAEAAYMVGACPTTSSLVAVTHGSDTFASVKVPAADGNRERLEMLLGRGGTASFTGQQFHEHFPGRGGHERGGRARASEAPGGVGQPWADVPVVELRAVHGRSATEKASTGPLRRQLLPLRPDGFTDSSFMMPQGAEATDTTLSEEAASKALREAQLEGLELLPANNQTGYKGVSRVSGCCRSGLSYE